MNFQPINAERLLLNQFLVKVECESPTPGKATHIYRVTIKHFAEPTPKPQKEWFILQHYTAFERLLKLLKKTEAYKQLLKGHGVKSLPKKPTLLTQMFSSNPDYVLGVTTFVNAIFSEIKILQVEQVQIFFAMEKHKINLEAGLSREPMTIHAHGNGSTQVPTQNEVNNNDQKPPVNRSAADDASNLLHNLSLQDSTGSSKDSIRNSSSIKLSPTIGDLAGTLNRQVKPTDFEFLKVIGKGSFGQVLLAQDRLDHTFYAVKVLNKQSIIKKNEQYHIMAERNVLTKNLSHPFLVSLHYSFQTPQKLFFVLDYVNGGELFFHLTKERYFPEVRARFYAAEIGSAIGYMHDQDILYRDLKPENLLLDREGHIVLTDFGLCKEYISTTDTTQTFCGTPEYLAPEVLQKKPYSKAIDWWCFGSVLYEMLYGLPPFYSRNHQEMYAAIINSPLTFKPTATRHAKSILAGLLQKNPKKRLGSGFDDFQEIKDHPFFNSINWDDLLEKKITPPFNPNVKDEQDLSMIDNQFKDEPLPNSVVNPMPMKQHMLPNASEEFVGFSYVRPSRSEFFDADF